MAICTVDITNSPGQSASQAFPYLGGGALDALAMLKRAICIYSFDTQHICWANQAALSFWNAVDPAELHGRQLAPCSPATQARLAEYRTAFAERQVRSEFWTFHPREPGRAAMCHCSGVSLDGHAQAMLVEVDAPDHFRAMFDDPALAEQVLADAQSQIVVWKTARMAVEGAAIDRIQVSSVRDPATGKPARLVAQEDVSELARVSTQLIASAEALEIVLTLGLNPALIFQLHDGRIIRINNAVERLLGPLEVLPATAGELFADQPVFDTLLERLRASHQVSCEVDLVKPGGAPLRVLVRGARLAYEQKDAVFLSIIDISELLQVNARLTAELTSERSMTEVRNRLLAIAAHDLRTPLAIIDSSAQYLARRADRLESDQVVKRTEQIRAAVRSLLKLFDSTVERARDREGLTFSSQNHDIVQLIRDVAGAYRELIPGFEPELELGAGGPLEIPLDRLMIEQMLGNILSNAIKFAAGAPRVRIWIEASGDSVSIFVRDWGIGIPETERELIFAEHRRGSNVGRVKGTGLGLSLVRHAVELHGGSIGLVEGDGAGTTFVITLPRN